MGTVAVVSVGAILQQGKSRNWFNLPLRTLTPPETLLPSGKGGGGMREEETVKSGDFWRGNSEGGEVPQAFLICHQTISAQILEQRPQPLSDSPVVTTTLSSPGSRPLEKSSLLNFVQVSRDSHLRSGLTLYGLDSVP